MYKLNNYYKIKIINHILFLSYNFEFKQITTEIILMLIVY